MSFPRFSEALCRLGARREPFVPNLIPSDDGKTQRLEHKSKIVRKSLQDKNPTLSQRSQE